METYDQLMQVSGELGTARGAAECAAISIRSALRCLDASLPDMARAALVAALADLARGVPSPDSAWIFSPDVA